MTATQPLTSCLGESCILPILSPFSQRGTFEYKDTCGVQVDVAEGTSVQRLAMCEIRLRCQQQRIQGLWTSPSINRLGRRLTAMSSMYVGCSSTCLLGGTIRKIPFLGLGSGHPVWSPLSEQPQSPALFYCSHIPP